MKKIYVILLAILFLIVAHPGAFASGTPEEETWDLPKTGQTVSHQNGSDGYYQMGIDWADSTRFQYVDDEDTVFIDKLTGLMWAKDPGSAQRNWTSAIDYAYQSSYADYTDWRLPNMREMRSLLHYGRNTAEWLTGIGFVGLQSNLYWTSTTYYNQTTRAYYVHLGEGIARIDYKTEAYRVLLVR